MLDILSRAGCFVTIIILGYVLKRKGFFKEEDFGVLSKVVLKITLPAAIVTSFAGKEIDPVQAAEHLAVHHPRVELKDKNAIQRAQTLVAQNGRLVLK